MMNMQMNTQLTQLLTGTLLCALVGVFGCSDNDDDDAPSSATCSATEVSSERLFLQQITSTSAIVKWRGDATKLCWGTDMEALNKQKTAVSTEGNHKEVLLTGLSADTSYFYSVGAAKAGNTSQQFRTAPKAGELPSDGNVHIWVLGDSGTGSHSFSPEGSENANNARAVRDGFATYSANNGNEDLDLLLMLGDNAYWNGTDDEHQEAVFEMYPGTLKTVALWPTIGNHEMGSYGTSISADPGDYDPTDGSGVNAMPYLDIFTLPSAGEAGGANSGTEQYYSFDYGNVHVVSLDSQIAARDDINRTTMKTWLVNDLGNNTSDWTIVIFHHPPYSKGSHDSDTDSVLSIDLPMVDMREEFVPVFDNNGVDFVYSGHSHSYERSYYIRNHTGNSANFNPSINADLNGSSEPASGQSNEIYEQVRDASGSDDSVVYTVAGSSGQISGGDLNHAAHFESLNELGSVVIDATENQFTAKFIGTDGSVRDSVTMTR